MRTRRELAEFVESLPITPERREIVRLELEDHVFERIAELEAAGLPTPEAERRAVEALGPATEVGAQLVRAELAYSISPRLGGWLGVRTGLFVAAISLVAAHVDGNPAWSKFWHFDEQGRVSFVVSHVLWLEPSPLYYVVVALALAAAWPLRVVRPFLAAQAHAVSAKRAGNAEAVRRLQEPAACFFAGLMTAASAPFLFWIVASGAGLPLGPLEGPLVRTILAAFVVNCFTVGLVSIAVLQASPEGTRKRA